MKILAGFAFAAVVALSGTAVNAMPVASPAAAGDVVLVAGGCGLGWHRGPYGGCRRNGYYGGRYWGSAPPGAPVPPGAYPCGGRGQHTVCGPGGCYRACN